MISRNVEILDNGYIAAGNTGSSNGDVSGNHGGRDFWILKLISTEFGLQGLAIGMYLLQYHNGFDIQVTKLQIEY